MTASHLECLVCGRTFGLEEVDYVCPDHGDEGILDAIYDYDRIANLTSRDSVEFESMWSYRALLPVGAEAAFPPLHVGGTPLYSAARLGGGLEQLWIKEEGVQPTGSLKDRASAMAIVKAEERQAEVVTTASTGNAAAALAGLAASVGQATVIFVPATAPEAKIAQLLAYGAEVLLVDGTYDDAVDLCLRAGAEFGWYNRTTGFNPYMSEGKKTVAHEIAHQLGWKAPDAVFVSVGDGCIIGGVWKGFHDLVQMGWISRMPRIFGVQSEGSNFLAEAWEQGEDVLTKPPVAVDTVADSIAAGLPRDRIKAMRAVTSTEGEYVTVSDEAILAAIPVVASTTGVFPEPAAAASWAGVDAARARGLIGSKDRVVVISTGTGLKDVPSAMRAVSRAGVKAHHVSTELESVAAALKEENK